jgi:phosphatidylinositol glycan class S
MSPEADTLGAADSAPANVVDAIKKQKEPPAETRAGTWTRRLVLLSFWAVAVFLGLPVWWKTTTVYRAPLPLQDMLDWADGKV